MDFFEAQARAKKRTTRLVFLFALAVAGTIAAGYFSAWILLGQLHAGSAQFTDAHGRVYAMDDGLASRPAFDPGLLALVAIGTLLIVGLASAGKWLSFRAGGSAVAASVGGRRLDPGRVTPAERQLLNVVEEMAIASGVPMPAVYVLDQEPGINAFAAGLTTHDAVVAVTRGTLEQLNRDELQGVIGHEFSHILNGDMRLNVKLTALVFGILVIGLLGRGIIWSLSGTRVRSSGNNKNSGGALVAIFAVGAALLIIGYIGWFFGRLIQAAVSRQREFLADASAVQFTRNPAGIGGALRKIGGYASGSRLQNNHATTIGHFFFAQGFRSNFGGLWATHPPLEARIRAIDPAWDGRMSAAAAQPAVRPATPPPSPAASASPNAIPPIIPSVIPTGVPPVLPFLPLATVAAIGQLDDTNHRQAQSLLAAVPAALRDASHDVVRAAALVYGLLLSHDPTDASRQREIVRRSDPSADVALDPLLPGLARLAPAARLPLLMLTLPALRQLAPAAQTMFLGVLDQLVHADARVSTFEFVLQKILARHLRLASQPNGRMLYASFGALTAELGLVLSVLARLGDATEASATAAYALGAAQLKPVAPPPALLPAASCGFDALGAALDKLAAASLPIKKRLLVAAAHVIGSDGTITVEEGELYRGIAAAIDCPLPPFGGAPTGA